MFINKIIEIFIINGINDERKELKKWVEQELKKLKKSLTYKYCISDMNKIYRELIHNDNYYILKGLGFNLNKNKIKYLAKAIAVFNRKENYRNNKLEDDSFTESELYAIEQEYCKIYDILINEVNDLKASNRSKKSVLNSSRKNILLDAIKSELKSHIISPEKYLDNRNININNPHEYLDNLQRKREEHEINERNKMSFNEHREAREPIASSTEYQDVNTKEQQLSSIKFADNNPRPIISRLVEKIVKLDDDSEFLSKIVGQQEAKNKIIDVLRGSIFSANDKPITFLFAGPTGVGKTETAKQISRALFDNFPLILDMESMHDDAYINNIIGSPRGYLGSDKSTQFETYITYNNGGVIILDEFEKADPNVRRMFLSAFDEGRISNGVKNYDLSKFIFVCTTNAGNIKKTKSVGFGVDVVENKQKENEFIIDRETLQKEFSPELLARMEIVEFKNLSKEDYFNIAKGYINNMIIRGFAKLGYYEKVNINIDNAVINFFVKKAIIEGGGARTIISMINQILSKKLIKMNNVKDSHIKEIYIKLDDGEDLKVDFVVNETPNISLEEVYFQ